MENKLLSFNEFVTLYESFDFITEAEVPDFTPQMLNVTDDDLIIYSVKTRLMRQKTTLMYFPRLKEVKNLTGLKPFRKILVSRMMEYSGVTQRKRLKNFRKSIN